VIVNPVINEGSSTKIISGVARQGVNIKPGEMDAVTTDVTGLSVIMGLPTGTVPMQFDVGSVDKYLVVIKENVILRDGVNITSRLQAISDPGEIYNSESVHKAIRGMDITSKYLGELNLKNVDYPVKDLCSSRRSVSRP